jgi:type I restriction enzyme M protein
MINREQLPKLLTALGFSKAAHTYSKTINGATLSVNFTKGEIIYPEAQGLTISERQTCNLDVNENFVVLECVHRLLEKGYKAEHIELEPKWKLGHGASGGRADILIKGNDGKPLLIIECKTAGSEFTRAWNKTLIDGDQLFSYAQQISETQFLCLYTSEMDDDSVKYTSHIIAHRDNEKYLIDNASLKGFNSVTDVKERYRIWLDTYKRDYTTKGIFEEGIQPYHIGKDKYSLDDLHAISAQDQQKKYHEFATILRQHNVSGRENAFDKLVNLFLCKLVDEIENPNELKFYWKGVAYDTHFELMDRLQQLYQAGMDKFLREDITYINQADVFNAMRFIRQNPDATQRAVWQLFVQQKFFTNNDFSLIDVHNEKLFYQNADVVLKILQMWQDIRLTNPDGNNQFLGDLFEGFLDQGVKQSEGQYFTPMPICKFIMMSLPLEKIVKENATPPKAIDYACGAGHFLNELALQIKPLVDQHQPQMALSDYHKAIFGIEKEYRLSKVAKVSAFMYGQQDINICYGDALVNQHAAFPAIKDNSFDILIANPPYSVRGFLETLPEQERVAYSLLDTIDKFDSNNSIETFFIERAKQLLKAGGVAAIILPSSILSNGNNTYVKTREILLQYFDIVAIAEFGSGTFGKTGTNTVTLFLRRKPTAPDAAAHYRERVDGWFTGCENDTRKQVIYKDETLIDCYTAHIGILSAAYKSLLRGEVDGAWSHADAFTEYRKAFNDSTEIKKLHLQKSFKALNQTQQSLELSKRYLAYAQTIERDKLYYFVMASDQKNSVLVIRSPNDSKTIKQFLGYDWSTSKGDEGIKLIKDVHGHHLTPLYDEIDRNNAVKLNHCVSNNFEGSLKTIPDELSSFASMTRLVDILDFSRVVFEKQIVLTSKKSIHLLSSRFPMEKLVDLSLMLRRGKSTKYGASSIQIIKSGQARGHFDFDFTERHFVVAGFSLDERQLQKGDLLINSTGKGTAGRVTYFDLPGEFVVDSHVTIFRPNSRLNPKFGLYSLARIGFKELESLADGASGQIELTLDTIGQIQIPLPPIEIQNQIVKECEAIDSATTAAKLEILTANTSIENFIQKVFRSGFKTAKLGNANISLINPSKTEIKKVSDATVVSFVEMASVSELGFISASVDKPLAELRKGSYTYFADDDIIIAKITPCMENGKCALAKGLTSGLGMGSSEFHVIRTNKQNVLPEYLFALLNRQDIRVSAEKMMTGSSGHRRVPASFYENLLLPIPSLLEQSEFVATIKDFERVIAEAQATIFAAPRKKQTIMQNYL